MVRIIVVFEGRGRIASALLSLFQQQQHPLKRLFDETRDRFNYSFIYFVKKKKKCQEGNRIRREEKAGSTEAVESGGGL